MRELWVSRVVRKKWYRHAYISHLKQLHAPVPSSGERAKIKRNSAGDRSAAAAAAAFPCVSVTSDGVVQGSM